MAKDIATNIQHGEELDPNDEESCMDFVISYLQSDALLRLEDEGMGQLLCLNDLICKLMNAYPTDNSEAGTMIDVSTHIRPNHTQSTTINPPPHNLSVTLTKQSCSPTPRLNPTQKCSL